MKRCLITFLILACIYPVYAQNARVTILESPIRIGELLAQIESQTEYLFVYNKRNVDVRRTVDISTESKMVSEILDEAFEGTGISHILEGNNIVLVKNVASVAAVGQNKVTIKGIVTDMKGEPIVGANVVEKGTSHGVITDFNGNFALDLSGDSELIITYIGYKPQAVPVNGRTNFIVRMEEEALALETIVVTAMGIKKKEASLTYSTQQVGGEELVRAKDLNMINTLAGKTAGVQINRSSSGLGGSVKVNIRGSRSLSGNNQPLYVIDGVPISNSITEQASTVIGGTNNAGNRDSGDGISNLNPDDIENINILKGASAAALYGSQAANGVILITTKKGKDGLQRVTFSSSLTVDKAISLPEFQNSYGKKDNNTSWGKLKSMPSYDNAGDFFQTGVTAINSISLTNGNEKSQTYFSYSNTTGKGIVELNKMQKHNLNFREASSFFNDVLTLDANINLMTQTITNRPTSGGFYNNPLVGLYRFPRGEDISVYKNNFEQFDSKRNMNVQNWHKETSAWEQNPYWITNRITSKDKRIRGIASISANLNITNWLSIQARGTLDYTNDKFRQSMAATTDAAIAGTDVTSGLPNGRYIDYKYDELLAYGDIMAMFNKKWIDFSLTGALGGSINSSTINSLRLDSRSASLYYSNQFSVGNIQMTQNAAINEDINNRRVLQSIFTTAQLGWKESLYLDLTARNDWSSTLAYTKDNNFFYPSVGVSWIINSTFRLPQWVSFAKLRSSWAQVGNDLPLFASNPYDIIDAGGKIVAVDTAPFTELKPELSSSYEVGTEWKFFNYRLELDFTFYKTSTKNQLLRLPSSAGAFYKYYYINAGQIDNTGFEATMGLTPLMNDYFRWKTQFNFSTNKNKIVKLYPGLESFLYGDEGFSSTYAMRLKEGGSFGDIYGVKFRRDENGNIITTTIDEEKNIVNFETTGDGNNELVGNSNPDLMLGWNNTFNYKNFSLYFLIDARFGGDVLSQTQADMDQYGVSKVTGNARHAGSIEYGGQTFTNIENFFSKVGGRSGITEYYMYSATNIRLREISLGYSFSRNFLEKTKIFKEIQLSLIARNLFFFYKDAPFDPDAVLSSGNGNQGIDVYGIPTTRSLGFNVKLTF